MSNTKLIIPGRYSALASLNRFLSGKQFQNSRFFIFVDENTYSNCLATLISHVSALENAEFLEIPAGEGAKQIEIVAQLWGSLLDSGADSNSVIINLGGGSVSDVGGFVAASFRRGIRYVNVPTTLLSMVDASIGGKTALDLGNTKNAVGFFHMPVATCIEPSFLETLPVEELKSGMGEFIKTLLISNPDRYQEFLVSSKSSNAFLNQDDISECASFKQCVVNKDPKDESIRHILNFGHTFGHAIESFFMEKNKNLSHGLSVMLGMRFALYLSFRKLNFPESEYQEFCRLCDSLVSRPKFTLQDTEDILSFMRRDKKNKDSQILCVLLQEPGVPVIDVQVDENEIRNALLVG